MYQYNLVDGIKVDGNIFKTVSIRHLSDSESEDIQLIAKEQYSELAKGETFKVVNSKHGSSIEGLIYLNEHTAASITKLGNMSVNLSFSDLCNMGVTAQDWQVIMSASMAVQEFFCCGDGEMLA
ncbi:hypothetical protein TUM17387_08860 [Shewanella carassii]|uniref:Uncharacterized protein n=1 Tax=Shewanella algae TaxID=38313 RepID=A0A7T8INY7_9GAMM|nr:hypothetical protein [Shewanella carassii]QQO82688.1 hypothetical protein D7032_05110 [Shewanella algae]BCV65527.1 hypothetical protein TUM17387_08860 [Shewanella carassii]